MTQMTDDDYSFDYVLANLFLRQAIDSSKPQQCDICGDYHDDDNIPLSCQTGDGE